MSHLLITHQGISDVRPLDYSEGKRCEGENSLKPEARISVNYGAKVYLALAPELHASLQEFIIVLEISLVTCIV
jgi:hypothetical protein